MRKTINSIESSDEIHAIRDSGRHALDPHFDQVRRSLVQYNLKSSVNESVVTLHSLESEFSEHAVVISRYDRYIMTMPYYVVIDGRYSWE